ncbi:MAG: MBL fold metallo-hydrolase [Bariatricus sp.]
MKISEHVHLIRQEFDVTPEVKRSVHIYLITGKFCYLIDSGVDGAKSLIEEYMKNIGRELSEIKAIFLTHSHPDHIGGAAELKRASGCSIYAPYPEISWIENIQKQFEERPIPNFFKLVQEPVKVDRALEDGDGILLEEGFNMTVVATPGHSHGSMCYALNREAVFIGDAVPVSNDLPIFVDLNESVRSLDRICQLPEMEHYCPAWDVIYDRNTLHAVVESSKAMLYGLKNAVFEVEKEMPDSPEEEKRREALKRSGLLQYYGNPLVGRSMEACKEGEL